MDNGTRVRLNISKNSRGYSYDFTIEMGESGMPAAEVARGLRDAIEHESKYWKPQLDLMVRDFEMQDARRKQAQDAPEPTESVSEVSQ